MSLLFLINFYFSFLYLKLACALAQCRNDLKGVKHASAAHRKLPCSLPFFQDPVDLHDEVANFAFNFFLPGLEGLLLAPSARQKHPGGTLNSLSVPLYHLSGMELIPRRSVGP